MPLVKEHGIVFVHWSDQAHLSAWKDLSAHIIGRFGKGPFTERSNVEPILKEGFAWMLAKFRALTQAELSLSFYKTLVGLYENSTHLIEYVNNGKGFANMSTQEYAHNRSSIRLALERACELELERTREGEALSQEQIERLEELLFVGMWSFSFSELIAMEKLMDGCNEIFIDPDDTMRMRMSHHYGKLLPHIRKEVERLTASSVVDRGGVAELKAAIKRCFSIDYDNNYGLVPAYLGHNAVGYPQVVDVPYQATVESFAKTSGFPEDTAKLFYAGLSLSSTTKESLENIIYRPHSNRRHMMRPILVWTIDGEQRAVIGPKKWAESIVLIVINAIQWGRIADEWKSNACMKAFVERKGKEHDKLLEDPVEEVLKQHQVKYSRNVTRLRATVGPGTPVDSAGLGEIDFLYLDEEARELCVVDCKYHRRRDNMVGYSRDMANFEDSYEPKLQKKVEWYKNNLGLVKEHFEQEFPGATIDMASYGVRGFFIINTPTYYSFNGAYRAYTIQEFRELMDGTLKDTTFFIEGEDGSMAFIQRPYFQKPITLNFGDLDLG